MQWVAGSRVYAKVTEKQIRPSYPLCLRETSLDGEANVNVPISRDLGKVSVLTGDKD